jgi:hypothetical protein
VAKGGGGNSRPCALENGIRSRAAGLSLSVSVLAKTEGAAQVTRDINIIFLATHIHRLKFYKDRLKFTK